MPLPLPLPDIVSLDLLQTVAKLGSIRQAAFAHSISQPAASTRLQSLERTLGLQLLERDSGGSRLTEAGTAVARMSEAVLAEMSTLVDGISSLRHKGATHLRLAASMTVAEYLIPRWLDLLRAVDPSISVSLVMGNSEEVVEMVRRRTVDLGFVEGRGVPQKLSSRVVGYDDLVVVVAPSHPWARAASISAEKLADTPLILREKGSGTREVLESALRKVDLKPTTLVELGSTTAIKAAVQSASGPAVLGRLATRNDVLEGKLVAVPIDGLALDRRLRAVWVRGVPLLSTAQSLLKLAVSEL